MPNGETFVGTVCLGVTMAFVVACGQGSHASGANGDGDASVAPDSSGTPGSPPGACPTGFVVCDGVCLEASLMGPSCRPAQCPSPPAGTVPPSRAAGVTARGFDWNVATDASGTTTVTFKP